MRLLRLDSCLSSIQQARRIENTPFHERGGWLNPRDVLCNITPTRQLKPIVMPELPQIVPGVSVRSQDVVLILRVFMCSYIIGPSNIAIIGVIKPREFVLLLRFSDSFKSYYDRRFCDSRGRAIYVPSLSRVWLPHPDTSSFFSTSSLDFTCSTKHQPSFYNSLGSRS